MMARQLLYLQAHTLSLYSRKEGKNLVVKLCPFNWKRKPSSRTFHVLPHSLLQGDLEVCVLFVYSVFNVEKVRGGMDWDGF